MPEDQVAACEECYPARVSPLATESRLERDKALENSICLSSGNVKGSVLHLLALTPLC